MPHTDGGRAYLYITVHAGRSTAGFASLLLQRCGDKYHISDMAHIKVLELVKCKQRR